MILKRQYILLFFLILSSCGEFPDNQSLSEDQVKPELEIIRNYYKNNNLDTAIFLSKVLLKESEEKGNLYGVVQANFWIAYLLKLKKEYGESTIYYLEGIRQSETPGYDRNIKDKIRMRKNLANTFRNHEANELATRYNLEGIRIAEEYGVLEQVVILRLNQGLVYQRDEQFDKAIKFFRDARRLADSISYNKISYKYEMLNQIGIVYLENQKYDSALLYFNQLLDIKDPAYYLYKALAFQNIGEIHYENGEVSKTIDLLRQTINILEKIENVEYNLFLSYRNLGRYLFETNQIEEAIEILSKAESIISFAETDPSSFEIYKSFSRLYHSIGNEELGNTYQKIYDKEMETYHGIQKENLVLIANRYFEKVEKEEKEERIAAIIFYGKIIVGSLFGGFLLILGYNRFNHQRSKEEFKREKRVSDLKALKAQINPHFLFNSLNSIQSFILEGEESLADDYLVKYGKLMRMILNHSNELTISIQEEIAALRLYAELEQLRLGKELNFEVKVADEIDMDSTKIPSMVIQPLIENSIWHGIQPKEGAGELSLDITKEDHWIQVVVADDGVGFDAEKEGENKPHGLKLAQERIDILNEVNGVESSFHVESSPAGTRIAFSYPADLGSSKS